MKKFSQCLMCSYVMGRSCKKTNTIISDEIYNNEIKCDSFKSLTDEDTDCDDCCCAETKRYEDTINNQM